MSEHLQHFLFPLFSFFVCFFLFKEIAELSSIIKCIDFALK